MTMHYDRGEFRRKNAGERADDKLELKSVMDALKARDEQIKAFAEKATAEIKDTGKMAAETKAALEKITTEGTELQERMIAVEQKLARRPGGNGPSGKSIAEQMIESEDFKALQTRERGTARLAIKTGATITSATTDAAGSAGDAIRPDRAPGVIAAPDRELTIRDLLMPGRTSSNAIEFVKETGFTNNAGTVAENPDNPKPKSDIQFELVSTNVRTIAHWFAASKQVLSDIPMLMSYINGRAMFGLKFEEEEQLLRGDGQGQNLLGILPQSTLFKQSEFSKPDDTMIDTIRRASLQVRLAEYRPTFVVMHPTDWCDIELTKDDDKRYIEVSIRHGGEMRLWRLNVVDTTAMDPGQFLVGASMGGQVFDREDAAVEVSTEHADFFTKNLIAIRAEERLALAVNRPECFVRGYFGLGDSPSYND